MAQCFKFLHNKNVINSIYINGHNTNVPPPTFYMNYSSMELVLFEKLPDIKLSRLIFRVTTFSCTKSSLNILLQYTKGLGQNIQTLYTRLVTNNGNQKTYEAPKET